ncbi:MAG: hypothetical protein AAF928_08250 [Myxococcota bacterium]
MKYLLYPTLMLMVPLVVACGDDEEETSSASGGAGTTTTTTSTGMSDGGSSTTTTTTSAGGMGAGGMGAGGGATSGIYELCGDGQPDCETGLECVIIAIPNVSSMSVGYCAPPCTPPAQPGTPDPACVAGFSGMNPGTCFGPDQCILICDPMFGAPATCPTGLSCISPSPMSPDSCLVAP